MSHDGGGDHGGGGDAGEGGHDMDMDMGMKMYFHAGTAETILFTFWKTEYVGGFVGSAIGIFVLALLYEALKFFREYLYERSASAASPVEYSAEGLLGGIKENIFKRYHLVQTLLHMAQLVLSYFLMLIFMTYNIWLGLAITLGAGVGYLLFGWNKRSTVDVTEHCH